jgi:hypothetical protein
LTSHNCIGNSKDVTELTIALSSQLATDAKYCTILRSYPLEICIIMNNGIVTFDLSKYYKHHTFKNRMSKLSTMIRQSISIDIDMNVNYCKFIDNIPNNIVFNHVFQLAENVVSALCTNINTNDSCICIIKNNNVKFHYYDNNSYRSILDMCNVIEVQNNNFVAYNILSLASGLCMLLTSPPSSTMEKKTSFGDNSLPAIVDTTKLVHDKNEYDRDIDTVHNSQDMWETKEIDGAEAEVKDYGSEIEDGREEDAEEGDEGEGIWRTVSPSAEEDDIESNVGQEDVALSTEKFTLAIEDTSTVHTADIIISTSKLSKMPFETLKNNYLENSKYSEPVCSNYCFCEPNGSKCGNDSINVKRRIKCTLLTG